MQRQRGGAKMEVYNEVENDANDAGDAYPHDATAGREHDELLQCKGHDHGI